MIRVLLYVLAIAVGGVCVLCGILQYVAHNREPLPSRPMFHVLNTEEIRGFEGPGWHIGSTLSDRLGHHIYVDEVLNLIVIIVVDENDVKKDFPYPEFDAESTTFYPRSKQKFTVPARSNAILVYAKGALASEAGIPIKGAEQFVNTWYKDHGWKSSCQVIIDRLGYNVSIPNRLAIEPVENDSSNRQLPE